MDISAANWLEQELGAGRYCVLKKLGEGGMGYVYQARDRRLDTHVVIKVPRRAMLADDPGFAERFSREIRSLVALSHPHIVKITDVGEHDGLPFAVMQYLPGGSLEDRRPKDSEGRPRPIRPDQLRGWLQEIARAVDFIHRKSYVHRDVKPENILFDIDKNAYLSDFGVAKALMSEGDRSDAKSLTGTGFVLGTPEYMAPEVILGKPFDGRADQYALAVMVYELLCGQPPFVGPTPTAVLVSHSTTTPPNLQEVVPTVSQEMAAAIARALAKNAEERYPNCTSFAEAVIAGVPAKQAQGTVRLPSGAPQATRATAEVGVAVQTAPFPSPVSVGSEHAGASVPDGVPRKMDRLWLWVSSAAVATIVLSVALWAIMRPGKSVAKADPADAQGQPGGVEARLPAELAPITESEEEPGPRTVEPFAENGAAEAPPANVRPVPADGSGHTGPSGSATGSAPGAPAPVADSEPSMEASPGAQLTARVAEPQQESPGSMSRGDGMLPPEPPPDQLSPSEPRSQGFFTSGAESPGAATSPFRDDLRAAGPAVPSEPEPVVAVEDKLPLSVRDYTLRFPSGKTLKSEVFAVSIVGMHTKAKGLLEKAVIDFFSKSPRDPQKISMCLRHGDGSLHALWSETRRHNELDGDMMTFYQGGPRLDPYLESQRALPVRRPREEYEAASSDFWESMIPKMWVEYVEGDKKDWLRTWTESGENHYWCQYAVNRPSGFSCLFEEGQLKIVLECAMGKDKGVHVIAEGKVLQSYETADQAKSDALAGVLLTRLRDAESRTLEYERELKEVIDKAHDEYRRTAAAVLGNQKTKNMSGRINARGAASNEFLRGKMDAGVRRATDR